MCNGSCRVLEKRKVSIVINVWRSAGPSLTKGKCNDKSTSTNGQCIGSSISETKTRLVGCNALKIRNACAARVEALFPSHCSMRIEDRTMRLKLLRQKSL